MIQWLKRIDQKLMPGPGKYVDYSTSRGCIRGIFCSIVITVILWNFDKGYLFFSNLFGSSFEISQAKQSWHQMLALIVGLPAVFASLLALIMIPFNRRRAIESAKGQWFDQATSREGKQKTEDQVLQKPEVKVVHYDNTPKNTNNPKTKT